MIAYFARDKQYLITPTCTYIYLVELSKGYNVHSTSDVHRNSQSGSCMNQLASLSSTSDFSFLVGERTDPRLPTEERWKCNQFTGNVNKLASSHMHTKMQERSLVTPLKNKERSSATTLNNKERSSVTTLNNERSSVTILNNKRCREWKYTDCSPRMCLVSSN